MVLIRSGNHERPQRSANDIAKIIVLQYPDIQKCFNVEIVEDYSYLLYFGDNKYLKPIN